MTIPGELFTLINKVSSKNGTKEDYENITLILSYLSRSELEDVFKKVDIVNVLLSIDLSDGDTILIASKLASVIFSLISLVEFVQTREDEILVVLNSTKYELIEFILQKLRVNINEAQSADVLSVNILNSVAKLVVTDELCVAKEAEGLILDIAANTSGALKILSNSVTETLISSCSKPEHYIRIADMAVGLTAKRPDLFATIENSGLLMIVLEGLSATDPLVFLNWLELTKRLALLPAGYQYLKERNVFDTLSFRFRSYSDQMLDLLLPRYLSLVGILIKSDADHWLNNNSSFYFNTIINAIKGDNPNICMAALECIAHGSSFIGSRRVLFKLLTKDNTLSCAIQKLGDMFYVSSTDVCVRATEVLGDIFHKPVELNSYNDVDDAVATLELAVLISKRTNVLENNMPLMEKQDHLAPMLKRLYSFLTLPYTDMRKAAYKALGAIATYPWGVHKVCQLAGFIEHLGNPRTEIGLDDQSQLLQSKMNVIHNILRTNQISSVAGCEPFQKPLTHEQISRLKSYVSSNSNGSVVQPTVAIDPG